MTISFRIFYTIFKTYTDTTSWNYLDDHQEFESSSSLRPLPSISFWMKIITSIVIIDGANVVQPDLYELIKGHLQSEGLYRNLEDSIQMNFSYVGHF